jgi:protein-tyrosine phosphatase
MTNLPRRVELAGCLNFRDLGGYPTADGRRVRWRQVFRSDGLHALTDGDVVRLREEIRLGDVIDLRSTPELQSEGRGPLEAEPVRFHHLPLFDGAMAESREAAARYTLADRYVLMAEFARGPIARVLDTLAHTDSPAVFHCAAGKDRTGVVSALILGLLGVDDEVIVADYVATREALDGIVDRLMALDGYRKMLDLLPPDTMHANPETMLEFLARLRESHGSFEGYARNAGLSEATVQRLRARLVE